MDPVLASLKRKREAFVEEMTPSNTKAAVAYGLKQYDDFCEANALQHVAYHPEVLGAAMLARFDDGAAENTIRGMRSAVAGRYAAHEQNPAEFQEIVALMKKIEKNTPPPKAYEEVEAQLFLRLLALIDVHVEARVRMGESLQALRASRDRLLFTTIFNTWQRPKSMVDLYTSDVQLRQGPPEALTMSFVGHREDNTKGPKNHQGGKHECVVGKASTAALDLVEYWQRFHALEWVVLQERGITSNPPKHVFYNMVDHADHFGKKLSASTPNSCFKKWMGMLLPPDVAKKYSLYSVKFGGYTAARRAGVSAEARKKHGGWKSDAHRGYNVINDEEMLAITQGL